MDGWMDGWMDACMHACMHEHLFSTISVKSDDRKVIMKSCVQWNPLFTAEKISRLASQG